MEIEIKSLSKNYGKFTALKDVNFKFKPGIYGLLGPNGAGKSTLMNIMTMNISESEGLITCNGKNIKKISSRYRGHLGYMPQQQNLYDNFTADQFMYYIASLKGISKKDANTRIPALLTTVNLADCRYKRISQFSGGMKQRLLIAQALLNDPELLIMDEPTAGLDPDERINIRNLMSRIANNKIVIISTHVISDIEFIADDIILLKKGQIIKSGTPEELTISLKGKVYDVVGDEALAGKMIKSGLHVSNIKYAGGKTHIRLIGALPDDFRNSAYETEPDIEDVYLYYQNRESRE